MNLNEELKTILRCKQLLSEAYSIGGGEKLNSFVTVIDICTSPSLHHITRHVIIE